LIPFLESIGIYKPPDVRPILQAYQGKDIPLEYAKREAEDKRLHIENWKKKGKKVDVTFSGLFSASSTPPPAYPPTYLEQKRKEAQQLYLEEMAFIEKNKNEFEKLIAQDREAAKSGMPDSLLGVLEAVVGRKKDGEGEEKLKEGNEKEAGEKRKGKDLT